jgi:hypothetical protein
VTCSLGGRCERLDHGGPDVTDPTHHLAVAIAEWIDQEVTEQRATPAQPARSSSLLLPQEEKDGGRGCWLGSRCQQAEVAHRVLVAVRDVLREQRDKLSRRARALKQRLRPGVFALIDDFLGGDVKDALLGYRKPPAGCSARRTPGNAASSSVG